MSKLSEFLQFRDKADDVRGKHLKWTCECNHRCTVAYVSDDGRLHIRGSNLSTAWVEPKCIPGLAEWFDSIVKD